MANSAKRPRRLQDAYAFPGFRPHRIVHGVFGDPKARVIVLVRRSRNDLRRLWSRAGGLVRARRANAGSPGPKAIGIDQSSIREGHDYRIVVSDLMRRRPIWFGGELSLDILFDGFSPIF